MKQRFEKYREEGNKIITELAHELGCSWNPDRAERILISILHSIRNRFDINDSITLLKQLPSSIKALYLDGWIIGECPPVKIKNIDDFIFEVRKTDKDSFMQDFPTREETLWAIQSVFRVMERFISNGNNEKIHALLPNDINSAVEEIEAPMFI